MMFSPIAEAAVGEEQALDQDHDADREGSGVRADEDRRERTPQQVPAGAGSHREVEHLDREDEDGDQSRQRGGPLVQLAARSAQADDDADRGDDHRHDAHRPVDEPVRDVHGADVHVGPPPLHRDAANLPPSCKSFATRWCG